jgi:hypothetical protein
MPFTEIVWCVRQPRIGVAEGHSGFDPVLESVPGDE